MDNVVAEQLAALNRTFYDRFAGEFARTRRGWPPGFDRILPYLDGAGNVVDIGCGNGRFLSFLNERDWRGAYVGIDGSDRLLAEAAPVAEGRPGLAARFVCADLLAPGWAAALGQSFGFAASIAVLHHIPGRLGRVAFLQECASLLAPGAALAVTTWQFLESPRLRARILPWARAGLEERQLEAGDYLLAWGALDDAVGLRYCAAIGREEMESLAAESGLEAVDWFRSDGVEGSLNLYGVFRRTAGS